MRLPCFNSADTLTRKIAYARKRKLAGVMIWELGQDSPYSQALLPKIVHEIEISEHRQAQYSRIR